MGNFLIKFKHISWNVIYTEQCTNFILFIPNMGKLTDGKTHNILIYIFSSLLFFLLILENYKLYNNNFIYENI